MDGLESGRIIGHGDVRQVIYGDNEANHYEWKYVAVRDAARSEKEGREVRKQVLCCLIHVPGGKNVIPKEFKDEAGQAIQQFFMMHPKAHRLFQLWKAGNEKPVDGTPIDLWPYMDEGQKEEFKAQRVYTIEQIAALPDTTLQTLGPSARTIKGKAVKFLEDAKNAAAAEENAKLKAELAELREMILSQKEETLKKKKSRKPQESIDEEIA